MEVTVLLYQKVEGAKEHYQNNQSQGLLMDLTVKKRQKLYLK